MTTLDFIHTELCAAFPSSWSTP